MTQTDRAADPRSHQEGQRIPVVADDLAVAQVPTRCPKRAGSPPVAVSGPGLAEDRLRGIEVGADPLRSRELVRWAVTPTAWGVGHRFGPTGSAGGPR
ncbi:hypothetical protein AB0L13_32235 [Saccharopolyspora shandongensis]|uniref:hypothetical protein n=1 Tax=Saccharopolyspora shandongensis TaxID=418495 RepID=UPI00344A6412